MSQVFAWLPVPLSEFRKDGSPADNWPHPCWVSTGKMAWLRYVEVTQNAIFPHMVQYHEAPMTTTRANQVFRAYRQLWRGLVRLLGKS